MTQMMRGDPRSHFDERYIPEPNSGCWLWLGRLSGSGYGVFSPYANWTLAHRFSLQMATGEEGVGLKACHHCDNPPCVNPDHLFWGTQTDNMRDALRKGRHLGGAFNAAKTHCPRGHLLSDKPKSDGSRYCPTCCGERNRRWYELNREKVQANDRKRRAAHRCAANPLPEGSQL